MTKSITLEDKLTELLDSGLNQEEIACAAAKLFLKHAPKKGFDGDYLRRIADYIDTLPKPVMLSAKEIAALITVMDKGLFK